MNYVLISYSDDGGKTFSREIWKPLISADKNYLNRVVIRNLGSAFNRVFRLRNADMTSFTLISAHADISVRI